MVQRKTTSPLRIALCLALLALFALPVGTAGAAGGMERFHPVAGVVNAPALPIPMRDAVLDGAGVSRTAGPAPADTEERTYLTPGGFQIRIRVSGAYAPDPAADQALADFLGSLDHGRELDGLRVEVETAEGLSSLCGEGAVACYYPSEDWMVVSGDESFDGVPTDFAIAHEYGHHVANHRLNPPFKGGALTWGTRRWFAYEGVREKVRDGVLSVAPNAYWNFPGENFAEAYAVAQAGAVTGWWYTPCMNPDAGAIRAIRKDALRPWSPHPAQFSAAGQISL